MVGTCPTNRQNGIQAIAAPDFPPTQKALENCFYAKKLDLLFDCSPLLVSCIYSSAGMAGGLIIFLFLHHGID
jgi:hypothetical protein